MANGVVKMATNKRINAILDSGFEGLAGVVDVKEYDWKRQAAILYAEFEETGDIMPEIDLGKLIGIVRYAIRLERELESIGERIEALVNG